MAIVASGMCHHQSVRVVLDTNILVSACWKPDGLEAQVVDLAMTGQITACVSSHILAEYRDVLSRRKLASVTARAQELLAALERIALSVEATTQITASIDDDDNRFLECATAAGADYVITGNLRHYPAELAVPHGTIRIVNARTFLTEALPHTLSKQSR
jgi:putative PIN family toxin of toxin-antitoxin system